MNKDVVWSIIGIILVILSYILLDKSNPENKWNKIVLFGLFSTFVVKLIYPIIKSKKHEKLQ